MKTFKEFIDNVPKMGINVKNADVRYADLIVDGLKEYETRETNSLKPYINKRVAIVRTGAGKAKAIGSVTVGKPIFVQSVDEFRKLEQKHLVPRGSKFDIDEKGKWLYPMIKPVRFKQEYDVKHGIISRRVITK